MRELVELRGDILSVPIVGGPVVHTMEVHAGREQIGIAAQAERCQIAAIAPAPQSDMLCIDIAAALQVFSRGYDILILRRATSGSARRFAKCAAIANSAAVIQRKNDVSTAGEVLIHPIGIRVVVHVVPTKEHLTDRSAMKKNKRGPFVSRFQSRRYE